MAPRCTAMHAQCFMRRPFARRAQVPRKSISAFLGMDSYGVWALLSGVLSAIKHGLCIHYNIMHLGAIFSRNAKAHGETKWIYSDSDKTKSLRKCSRQIDFLLESLRTHFRIWALAGI